ncbi:MAG TPA: histidine kinase [Gaiellaceae bacterium]
MSFAASLYRRVPWVTPASLDVAAASVLTIGAVADVARLDGHYLVGSVLAVLCTGTVAWRRRAPAAAASVAVTALVLYQLLTSDSRMTFEPYAVVLTFYMVGRQAPTRYSRTTCAVLLGYALIGFEVVIRHGRQGGVVAAAGAGILAAALPWMLGWLVARHSALADRLAVETAQLRVDQELRTKEAANEERYRMARELHDVVAHCVSVMVIQASAARLVAAGDTETARRALGTVVACGREAMVELRRMVGAVRHRDGELEPAVLEPAVLEPAAPGLDELAGLAARARELGVLTRLRISSPLPLLPPGLELALYRIVQEALTNIVKHAPGATADVEIGVSAGVLRLSVVDTGARPAPAAVALPESGHGLAGMRERVAIYRGDVGAGPAPDGGWILGVTVPLATGVPVTETHDRERKPLDVLRRLLQRRADRLLAGVWFVALEIEALTSGYRTGPLWLNALLVGSMALAFAWRRRNPLAFLVAVGLLGLPLAYGLATRDHATLTGLYSVLVPTYAVAAWEEPRRAVSGLLLWCVVATLTGVVVHAPLGGLAGPLLAAGSAWALGRVIRAHRRLIEQLRETSARVAAERGDRARLAALGERIRIAGDLQRIVARDVIAMVVQAEAAESLLADETETAIGAIEAIEATGREALVQVRLILGVLRNRNLGAALDPQPGLDQIHTLVERARLAGQPVELTIEGEPGTVFAGVDLTTYRILEEVLGQAATHPGSAVVFALRFDHESLRLDVSATGLEPRAWPTPTIRDRVALCNGELDEASSDGRGARLVVRLPRRAQGALT